MDIKIAFAKALKKTRHSKCLSQEAFSDVSSRTYISTLERGMKSPTLDKVNELAITMGIQPLTLLTLSYMIERHESEPTKLFDMIRLELDELQK